MGSGHCSTTQEAEVQSNAVGLSDTDTIKLAGLRSVLERLHREGVLKEQVGDGTRYANLYETTPEKVLALQDMILAEFKHEEAQNTELQIEPLGPSDATPPEGGNPQMEVAVDDERPSINFKNLGWGTKGNIRSLARSSKSLLEEEDLPDYFKAILSNLLNTIVDLAGSDELLKKILEESDADTG